MTTVTNVSPTVSKDCDPVYVDVTTDSIGNIIPFFVDIYMNNPYETTGLSHTFVFNGEAVTISSTTGNPCSSVGYLTGLNTPGAFEAWLEGVIEVLLRNYYILCNFDLSLTIFNNGRGRLRFLAKDCFEIETFEFVENQPDPQNTLGWAPVTNTGTFNDYFVDGRTQAFISVLKVNPDGSFDKSIELCADWDIKNKSACFQINKAFDLRPHLPRDPFSLDYMTTDVYAAFDCFCVYKIISADKIVSTNSVQCVQTTDDVYTAICGSLGCYTDVEGYFDDNVTILHHLTGCEQPDIDLVKCVNINQPDWTYFYIREAENIQAAFTFVDENGVETESFVNYVNGISDNGVYYIPTGPGSINIPQGTVEYCVTIQSLPDPGVSPEVYGQRCYKIDCECHPYDCYLIYFNGCGGMDTLYLRGKKKISFETERETFSKLRHKDTDKRYGSTQILCAEGKEVYKVSTGLHDLNQIGLLRQLLLGEVWLVNTTDKTFVPVQIRERSFAETDDEFYAGANKQSCLEFTLELDQQHCHYNPTKL